MSIGTTVSTNISPDISYTILESGTALCNITLTPGVWMIHGSITWPGFNGGPIFTGIYKDDFIQYFSTGNSTIFLNAPSYNQPANDLTPTGYSAYQTLSLIETVIYDTTYSIVASSPNGIGYLTPYANNIYPMDLYATRIA